MKNNRIRRTLMIAVLCMTLAGSAALTGCGQTTTENSAVVSASSAAASTVTLDGADTDDSYSEADSVKITLDGTSAKAEGDGVSIDGGTVTIKAAGTYVVSGTLSDGSIVIDAGKDDQVKLVLNNADISSTSSSAIYAAKCAKTIILLAEGTTNTVSDGSSYVADSSDTETDGEDLPNAAVFVKDDLTILGEGTLNVKGNARNGITSKDTLIITGGNINITSANHGLTGKDNLHVSGGTLSITSGGDGMRSTYSDETDNDKGHVYIEGGTVNITSTKDGIQSEKNLTINGGTVNITSGSGENASEDVSRKGLKSGYAIAIGGGEVNITSPDDGIHSNDTLTVSGGKVNIKAGDDGIHADSSMTISDGTVTISEAYEGLEAETVTISGGTLDITSTDDGINCAGGDDNSGFGGMDGNMKFGGRGGGMNDVSDTAALTVSGGTVYVNAQGDGLDSNGSMDISGGTIVVNGTTQGGNGIIDHGGKMTVTGGTIVGAGTSDMLEMPDDASTEYTMVALFDNSQAAGTLVYVTDSSGKVIAAMSPEKNFGCFILTSPSLKSGETYNIYLGGTVTGESTHGYCSNGAVDGGTLFTSFTLSDKVTYVNSSGVTTYTGMGGKNFDRGQMPSGGMTPPNGMTPPDGASMPEGMTTPQGMTPPGSSDQNNT